MSDPRVEVCESELCVSLELEHWGGVNSTLHGIRFSNTEQFTALGDHMVGDDGECLAWCPGCTVERGSGAFRITR